MWRRRLGPAAPLGDAWSFAVFLSEDLSTSAASRCSPNRAPKTPRTIGPATKSGQKIAMGRLRTVVWIHVARMLTLAGCLMISVAARLMSGHMSWTLSAEIAATIAKGVWRRGPTSFAARRDAMGETTSMSRRNAIGPIKASSGRASTKTKLDRPPTSSVML